jgi:hypothetical protein
MKIKVNDVCKIAQNTIWWRRFTVWGTINSRRGDQEGDLQEVTPSDLAGSEHRLGGTYWLHLCGGSHILKKECVCSNTLVNIYQTTRRKFRKEDCRKFLINTLWQSVSKHVNYLNFRVLSAAEFVTGNGWHTDWLRSDRTTRRRNVWMKWGGGIYWIHLAHDRNR